MRLRICTWMPHFYVPHRESVSSIAVTLELCHRLDSQRSPTHVQIMPSSDYSSAIGGGLKLKGSSSGIDKSKKKKKKSSKPNTEADSNEKTTSKDPENSQSALQKALADTDDTSKSPDATEITTYGKTEAQRRYEERRKKRVRSPSRMAHEWRRHRIDTL